MHDPFFHRCKMKYKYYFGASGSGKSYKLKKDIIEMSQKYPDKNFILIVPDQFTMQTQKEMVEMHPNRGIMNIDVLSFGRLSYKVYEEVGHPNTTVLDDTGKNLILRRVSLDRKDELKCLGSSLARPGYIHLVKSVISEFMQYGMGIDEVGKLLDCCASKKALKGKLFDIKVLYEDFLKYKKDKFVTIEETLTILAKLLEKSEFVKDSIIVFDGFTGFTPLQRDVIAVLMRRCDEVWFSLTIDKAAITATYDETGLFALTRRTIDSIDRLASENHQVRLPDICMGESLRFSAREDLIHLEKNLFRSSATEYKSSIENIYPFKADNPREELRGVCHLIRSLVRNDGYAYKDIAIVTGDLEVYASYANELFGDYDIPVFVDSGRKLGMNPFTEYIKSALEIISSDFSYESVMHYLRSGLSGIPIDRIDRFDNYILALKVRGYSNYSKEFARTPAYMKDVEDGKKVVTKRTVEELEAVNITRQMLTEALEPIIKVRGKAVSAAEYTTALYDFIVSGNIYDKLIQYAVRFEENGDYTAAREYRQIYRYFMELLEQLYELIGDDYLTLEEYIDILNAGIEELSVGLIPAETDYVLFGDIERSRLRDIKALFFIGVNDSIIPKSGGEGGMISDMEREFLADSGFELSPSPRQKMYIQRLYLYMNMTKPTERLYVSYSAMDSVGKSIRPSYLISTLNTLFPDFDGKTEYVGNEYETNFENIEGIKDAQSLLAGILRKYAAGGCDDGEERRLFALYDILEKEEKAKTDMLKESAFFEYRPNPISKALTDALYKDKIINTVSTLEKYAECAYSHFLRYGLKLEERETYSVEYNDLGNVYHQVFEAFTLYVKEHNIEYASLDDTRIEEILDELFEQKVSVYNESLFYQDATSTYRLTKMRRILFRSIKIMVHQIKKTSFYPKNAEVNFVSNLDKRIDIRGRIDRIDTYEDDENVYVKVVDYKSGDKKFDIVRLYYGLNLQLVVYLDQAVKREEYANRMSGKKVKGAGMFYYHICDPFIDSDKPMTEEEIDAWMINDMRLNGLSVNDEYIIEKLGGEFDVKSEVIRVGKTAKGNYDSKSQLVSSEDLDIMRGFANMKIKELGNSILAGNIEASPCEDETCGFCPYSEVCSFDKKVDGYEGKKYEKFGRNSEKIVIEKMKEYCDSKNGYCDSNNEHRS